jgi:hypothetical protein
MFAYGDLVVERQIYRSGATSKIYMFIESISIDPKHCIVYDIQCNNLQFKDMYSLVSRKKFIGIKPLILVTDYVANTLVRQQIKTFVENQQLIAKQKFVFLKGIIDRGVVLRVNGKKFSPTDIQLNLTDTVYWQDMIELTGWKQVGGIDDYIHLSTLLPNCLYLQKLVEID